MRRWLFLLLLLLLVPAVTAQDTPRYRLRTPSVMEYLTAARGALARIEALPLSFPDQAYANWYLVETMEHEFLYQYDNVVNTNLLLQAYDVLNQGYTFGYAEYLPFIDLPAWNMRIVKRWLSENPTDLTVVQQFAFDRYTIRVERHNLDGVGQPEIILLIDSPEFSDHWLAFPDSRQPSGYRLENTPLVFRAGGFWWSQPNGLGARTELLRDVNADGKVEWVASLSQVLPGTVSIGALRSYFVYGWVDGALDVLTAAEEESEAGDIDVKTIIPNVLVDGDVWHFENVDNDAALELLQNEVHPDNWDCRRIERSVYDWDGVHYLRRLRQIRYEQTPNCSLRFAEQNLLKRQYDAAIRLYEQALRRYASNPLPVDAAINPLDQLMAYAQERLVIAYSLAGREAEARSLLDSLRDHPLLVGSIAEQLLMIPDESFNRFTVCWAAYRHLEQQNPDLAYRGLRLLGRTEEDMQLQPDRPPYVHPAHAGCDFPRLSGLEALIELRNVLQTAYNRFQRSLQIHIRNWGEPVFTTDDRTQLPQYRTLEIQYWSVAFAFRRGDFERVLTITQEALRANARYFPEDFFLVQAHRYYRALALEALGQYEEALAEYVVVYESAPDGAWGILAALHIEPIGAAP